MPSRTHVDGSGTADAPPVGPAIGSPLNPLAPGAKSDAEDEPPPNAALGASEPASAAPPPEAIGLPLASDAAIVTNPAELFVPPITRALCTIEFAVTLAPALTTVSPVPVIAPTCWFVPLTRSDPPDDSLLL